MAGVCDHNMCIEITMSTSNSLKHILYMCVRLRMKLEYAFFNPTAKSVIFFFRTNHIYLSCLNISTLCIIKKRWYKYVQQNSMFHQCQQLCWIHFCRDLHCHTWSMTKNHMLLIIQSHISISSIDYIIIILLISCSEFGLAIGRNYVNKLSI